MIEKSKEEKELENKEAELKRTKEELEIESHKLEKAQYSRRLKIVLMKTLGISSRDLKPDRYYLQSTILANAVLDQMVEIIFDIFPCFEYWSSLDFPSCLQLGSFRMAIFDDEEPGQPGLKRLHELDEKSTLLRNTLRFKEDEELKLSKEDLKTLDLSRDDLMRIIFAAVIQAAVKEVFPEQWCDGSIHDGGPTH